MIKNHKNKRNLQFLETFASSCFESKGNKNFVILHKEIFEKKKIWKK
jgi:hypothetical protein